MIKTKKMLEMRAKNLTNYFYNLSHFLFDNVATIWIIESGA